MAVKRPTRKTKLLPDNTSAIELIAEKDRFKFSSTTPENLEAEITYIQEPRADLEFAYAVYQDKIIFSNSIEVIKKLLNSQDEPAVDLNQLINNQFNNLIINLNYLPYPINFNYLLLESRFLNFKKLGGRLIPWKRESNIEMSYYDFGKLI